jgi:ubiquinone/menaquinone biosynthesis C-methylase UbiE
VPHKFSPRSIKKLLCADRFADIDIAGFLKGMGLASGMTFADIGCGPGFFTRYAMDVVGREGLVYAVDVQQEMLDALKETLGADNLRVLLSADALEESSIGSLPIEDASIDFVLCAYTLHEASCASGFLGEMQRVMKPGATLVIIDWDKLRENHGPPYEDRIPEKETEVLITNAGLQVVEKSTFSSTHYLFRAIKSD